MESHATDRLFRTDPTTLPVGMGTTGDPCPFEGHDEKKSSGAKHVDDPRWLIMVHQKSIRPSLVDPEALLDPSKIHQDTESFMTDPGKCGRGVLLGKEHKVHQSTHDESVHKLTCIVQEKKNCSMVLI